MSCLAPALPPGRYYIGLLIDAACDLLDLNKIIEVFPDPVFEPFEEIFSETDFLEDNIEITISVGLRMLFI